MNSWRNLLKFDLKYYLRREPSGNDLDPPTGQADIERGDLTFGYNYLTQFTHISRYYLASKTGYGTIVDLGCGTGYGTAILVNSETESVIGLDVSFEACQYGCFKWGGRADYVNASAFQLPCAFESVDMVICFEVYEHVIEQQALLTEIHRILKPGGYLWISTPNLHPFTIRARHFFLGVPMPDPGPSSTNPNHLREVPYDLFVEDVSCKFEIIEKFGLHLPLPSPFGFLYRWPFSCSVNIVRWLVIMGYWFPQYSETVVIYARKQ